MPKTFYLKIANFGGSVKLKSLAFKQITKRVDAYSTQVSQV
jgi:hypothetical protein